MAVRTIRRDILESLSAEIDALFKQVELKYWGLLPWDEISEKLAVQDFFRELSRGKKEAIIAYSNKYSPEEKLAASYLHDMACSELTFWAKSISRRLYFTARHSHPWVVEFSSRLQTLVFEHIIKTLTCSSSFAVNIHLKRTAKERKVKERTVEIINYRKLCQLFAVAGNCETSLKKDVSGKGRVNVIVNDSKPFVLTYNEQKETVTVMCHYGSWNTDGVPQFI